MATSDRQTSPILTREHARLEEDRLGLKNWRRWGPYVSERSWGTVREDYSSNGDAWSFLTHNQARSKAYRWGEDGLAGLCDRYQLLVFAIALWNERDPFLKERLFGVVPREANHGEDVKEVYYYLDATPTHSYLRYLYKYPQCEFPYQDLVETGRRRSLDEPEYELLDTGAFDDNRYFDVQVEYAKADTDDLCIRIEIINRGPEVARVHLLPHLWFRNRWSWTSPPTSEPIIYRELSRRDACCLVADDARAEPLKNLLVPYELGKRYLYAAAGGTPLFTNNESHNKLLYGPKVANRSPYVKDAFHRYVVDGQPCINPAEQGTKACVHYSGIAIEPAAAHVVHLRLTDRPMSDPLSDVDRVVAERRREADEFYEHVHPPRASEDEKLVQRQALSGMIWTQQIYLFDVDAWLSGDNADAPPPAERARIRNYHWRHLNSMRILSMPDKWEYPWFAAWDLAFHCIPLALVDPEFAKEQLWLLLFEQFQHPNGQIPAYEWEFSDLNPPVHAWAVWRVYNMDRLRSGRADRTFLEKCFHKLLINFAWWVNKVDSAGNNVFEGGFLGLDNITTFDRSERRSDGTVLKQADATGWMGMFCLNLMRIALELAKENPAYVSLATKFFEHYVYIGSAMKNMGGRDFQLWSEQDGMFYDVLLYPDGSLHRFHVRSLVSLIPLFAVERLEDKWIDGFSSFKANLNWFLRNRPALTNACVTRCKNDAGEVYLLSLVNKQQLERIMTAVWNPSEFRSRHGLRSLSKHHAAQPFGFGGQEVVYDPGESRTWIKGGNSNWRGPIWFPTTFLLIESLRKASKVYGDSVQIPAYDEGSDDCPDSDSHTVNLSEIARGFADRMISLFTRDAAGHRPIFGQRRIMQEDPAWRDCLLFHEYFHAETGEGLGASHQTGWTALVATLIDEWRR